MIAEHERIGRIDVLNFYARHFFRLFPSYSCLNTL
jgi:hypothetical protein